MIEKLIGDIEQYNRDSWLRQPRDIDSLLQRKGAKGSNLTIDIYMYGDANAAAYLLFMMYNLAEEERFDLETLKELAGRFFTFQANRLKSYYHMQDCLALTNRLAEAAAQAEDCRQLGRLLRAAQRLFGQLAYWVDLVIPWSELSELHAKLMEGG